MPVRLLELTYESAVGFRVIVVSDDVTEIRPVCVTLSEPIAFVAVSLTVNVPPPL